MAMLIFKKDDKGCKSYKIPECEVCKSTMLPKDLDNIESGIWKCPYCIKEKDLKNDR